MDDDAIEFAKITATAVSSSSRVVTVQVVGVGAEGDDDGAQSFDDVESAQPCGLMARPALSRTTEGVCVRRGDEMVALVLLDKGAPAQDVEAGETRLYGVGSDNATAVIRLRAVGAVQIVAKTGQRVDMQGATQAFVRGDDYSTALNTAVDAIKVLNIAVGAFATAVGGALPPVAAAAVTLNTAIGVCNSALDTLKSSSSVWLSTKIKGE